MDNKSNANVGDGEKKEGDRLESLMMASIPRRSLPPARPPESSTTEAASSSSGNANTKKAAADALENMTIPRRPKIHLKAPQQSQLLQQQQQQQQQKPRLERGSSSGGLTGGSSHHHRQQQQQQQQHHHPHHGHGTHASGSTGQLRMINSTGNNSTGSGGGVGSSHKFHSSQQQQHLQQQQPHQKPAKLRHVTIESEYPFMIKIRLKGVPLDEGITSLRASTRTPKRVRPSYEEVGESDGLVDSDDDDDDEDDETYAARPKKLRRGSQNTSIHHRVHENHGLKVGSGKASSVTSNLAAKAASKTGSEVSNFLDPGSGGQALPNPETGLLDAPPPGMLSSMWYSRECFLHVFVVEKIVGWKRRPVTSLEWEDPNALKILDPHEAINLQQKALTNGDFWNDPRKRIEVSRINVTQCPTILAIAAERETAKASEEGRDPHFKIKTSAPDQREEVLLVKWRGRSYLHCSWERPGDIQKQDPSNSTARHKIRRYYQAQEIAFGKDWKKVLEEERATAAAIHSHGEVASAEAAEQAAESEELFPPQFVEVERILGCDESEMDMNVLAKQRALNIRTEQEVVRRKEEAEATDEAGEAAKAKSNVLLLKDLIDIHKTEEPWDPEDNVRYVVKWKGLPFAEMTWEYWRDIKRDAVDEAEDFWHRQKPPSPELLEEILNIPHPHVKDFRKLQDSTTYGISSRVRPVADLGDGPIVSEEDDNDIKQGFQLRSYQLEGVNWLLFNWWNKRSCILADEMGLGKTVQTLGFLQELYNNPMTRIRGPFLIVAPLSLIGQWQSESRSWAPDFNVVLYHGSADAREFLAQQEFYYTEQFLPPATVAKLKKKHVTKFHILITTYEVVLKDIEVLSRIRWKTLIVDEAHRLKNPSSRLFAELASVPRDYCVLLTGTPLANNTEELWALLHFDDPKAFNDREGFMEKFGQMNDSTQVSELHTILKPYLLRRVKEDVEKSLPPKEETILEVSLTPTQKKYYKAIYERNTAFLFKGAKPSNAPSLMNVMMELRKVCNHPYLVKGVEDRILADAAANWKRKDENGNDLPVDYIKIFGEQLVKSSGKMVLLEKLLSKLFTGGHKVLIFSQMVRVLDLLEELLKMCKYKYERLDGSTSSSSRAAAVDRFNRKSCHRFVMLLSTRAGGLGLNLTSADIVIIFDSDWNPQNDLQAMARAHRIGQTRKVQIFRLLTSKTYELHMFNSASMKLGLERAVLAQQRDQSDDIDENQKKPKSDREAHAKEIDELLKKGAYDVFRDDDDAEAEKFMESDIDQLLERSSKKVTYGASSTEALGSGLGSFSKASFVTDTGDGEKDVDLDDPDFWAKAVGLEAPVETPEEVAQMIDDGVKRSRKQVQQFNPHAEFQEKELRKEEEKERSLLEKKDKKKKKKKKEGKEEQEGQQENKEGNTEKKKKKKRDHEELENPLPGKDNIITPTPTTGPAQLSAPVLASASPTVPAATASSATTPTESVKDAEVKPKKRKRNDRRRVLLRASYIDPVIERLKQGWEAPQRNRATAAALRFGFGRFNKIRHESNLTSLPTQDLEVFIRSYMYQIALQVAVTFLARLHKSGSQIEQNFRTIIREWIGPGSEAEIEWLCSTVYSVMEHHMQVQSSRRFLRMPVVLAEASYMHTLRQGAAFRALRRMGILSRLNRVIEEGLETVLSVLGYEELAKRGCATNDLSTLDADLRARHVSTEELLLVTSAHYRKPVNLEAPASWWDRNCDVALVIGSFVHGLGNYEAMRNDDDLPFIHNMRSFAESDEACSSASSSFHAAAAACRRVFELALDAVKTKAAEEIQAAVAAAAAAASEREQNALALRQGGAAADAVLSNTQDPSVESAPKEEVVPALDDRFVTLPKLRKAILEAVRATVVKATPSKESQAEPSNSELAASVEVVVPESSVTAADGDLPMPDSRVLDRRLIELLNRVENSLDEFDEDYKILEPGNNWKAGDDIIVISELRKKALSKLYTSQDVLGSLMSEYVGVGINGNQCGSSHRSLDDGTDYSIGAASSDLSLVGYGVDAPRYLRAIGVPMNLTRFAICAIIYANESTLQDMLAAERIRNYGSQQVEVDSKEEKGDDSILDDKAEPETNSDKAQQALQNEIVSDSKPEVSTPPPTSSLPAEPNESKQDSQNNPLPSLSSEPKEIPHIIPEGLKHSVKARAAICSAILLYGFPSPTCRSSMVNSALWTSLSDCSGGTVDGREPRSLFNMDKFMERVKSLADNEKLPTAEEVGYYVEKIFLPFCLRLCIMGNGPSTRNARGSKGEYETAFGISQYPEPSKAIQSPLPDPCLAIEQQSLEAVNHASAILRRVRLMRAALHVAAGGDVSVEQVSTVTRSSFICKNLDGLPLWWCPWVHDVGLLVHAAMNGLFAIIQDRQSNIVSVGIFSRESIVSSMSSTFVADETVLPKPIIERSAPSDPQEWISLHAEEFPTVNVLERRLAFLCSQATVALEGEIRYDNLPMFDHGGWPRV